MTRFLPPGCRCTAFWYAQQARLLTGDGEDPGFLLELGLLAARRARWAGIPEMRVAEGPYWVHTWPEAVWDATAGAMAQAAAETGDWHLSEAGSPVPRTRAVHCQRPDEVIPAGDSGWGGDGPHQEYDTEVIPPWCPLPQGDQALRAIGF